MGVRIVASGRASQSYPGRRLGIYDITLTLSPETVSYPGDPAFRTTSHSSLAQGDPFNLTSIAMSSHLGTHVDACSHFVRGGATIDQAPLEALVGPAVVRHVEGRGAVGPDELVAACIPETTERVLLKIGSRWLSAVGAGWLVERGLKLVGTDGISIDALDNDDFPAHRRLLSAGILVVECLDLEGVPEGGYTLYCLPLKVAGGEAAPARAILVY